LETRRRGNDGGVQGAINDTLDQARTAIAETQYAIREQATRATADTEKYVKQNPWKALAIAGGIGFVLALLIRR
jgi:ElaB/YqjD/DUF883 family membrane-anchored ribosome-binding protein